jgi:hypothetical protein
MTNRPWLNIPESDFQTDDPVAQPVEIMMLYDDPIEKDQTRRDGSGTFKAFYYGVDMDDSEYTLSASESLHKMIQGVGATQGTLVKILKRRIGDNVKDIRYTVTYEAGPIDQDKIDLYAKATRPKGKGATVAKQPTTNAPPAPTASGGERYYLPLRENENYMALAEEIGRDKVAVWSVLYNIMAESYPDESSEFYATRATHFNIDIQKELYHKWVKEPHLVLPPKEELEDREQAVVDADLDEYPKSIFVAVAVGHEGIDGYNEAKAIIKKFGYTKPIHIPKTDKDVWLQVARIAWRYQDRIDQGMIEYYAMVGTADEFDMPYDILALPDAPDDDPEF